MEPTSKKSDISPPLSMYTPIQQWQTRILRLHSEQDDGILRADLLVADMVQIDGLALHDEHELVAYEAISYTWGGEEQGYTHELILNTVKTPVTPNLGNALTAFQPEQGVRYIWADALCINQSDNDEKSIQVANMMVIYRKATTVLVWLGQSDEEYTEISFGFLRTIQDAQASLSSMRGEYVLSDEHKAYVRGLAWRVSKHDWLVTALYETIQSTWARRVWVQQEIFVARSVKVYRGRNWITFQRFWLASYILKLVFDFIRPVSNMNAADESSESEQSSECEESSESGERREFQNSSETEGTSSQSSNKDDARTPDVSVPTSKYDTAASTFRAVMEMRRATAFDLLQLDQEIFRLSPIEIDGQRDLSSFAIDYSTVSQSSFSPEHAVFRCHHLDATDVRDKIYAVLGMTNCRTSSVGLERKGTALRLLKPYNLIRIDYSQTASKTVQDFTKYLLNRDSNLDVLTSHWCVRAEGEESSCDNALGLPSWTPAWTLGYEEMSALARIFGCSAADWLPLNQKPLALQEYDDAGVLRLCGTRVAEILPAEDMLLASQFYHTQRVVWASGETTSIGPANQHGAYGKNDTTLLEEARTGDCFYLVDGTTQLLLLRPLASGGFSWLGGILISVSTITDQLSITGALKGGLAFLEKKLELLHDPTVGDEAQMVQEYVDDPDFRASLRTGRQDYAGDSSVESSSSARCDETAVQIIADKYDVLYEGSMDESELLMRPAEWNRKVKTLFSSDDTREQIAIH